MEAGFLVPALAFVTLGAGIIFGIWSINRTRNKSNDEKSSLAKDGPGPQPFR